MAHSALLLVDVQYDFISGSLAVPGAAEVLAPTYHLLDAHPWDLVLASQACQSTLTRPLARFLQVDANHLS